MKLKEDFKKELFRDKEELIITKKTVNSFFERVDSIGKKFQQKKDEDSERSERTIRGTNLKADDLNKVAEAVVLDLAWHLNQVDFDQRLVDDYKSGKLKSKPRYYKQEQVDKYKIELAKLFHSLSIKLRLAMMFGFGEEEGVISVIDTKQLPSIEKAKQMDKKKLRDIFKKATDKRGKVDNKSTKIFKDLKTNE